MIRCIRSNLLVSTFKLVSTLLLIVLPISASAKTFSGKIEAELRSFLDSPQFTEQHAGEATSIALEPEYFQQWNEENDSLTFKPFYRWDQQDEERTHADVRELMWNHVGSSYETKIGIGKVFWGVTESQHLVDIINQTDLVEAIDGEEKLGQPMMVLSVPHESAGVFDFYVLPSFRERNFPGMDARLRFPLAISDEPEYESSREDEHADLAFRWSDSIGDAEVAISQFSGTSRAPRIVLTTDGLTPYYDLIQQTGIEYQISINEWLWKLEYIFHDGFEDPYSAAVGGFEYTLVGIWGSAIDAGLIMEYHFDERKDESQSPLQNDTFFGTRIAFNDAESSEILAGFIIDNDTQARIFSIEAARRFGESLKLSLEGGTYSGIEAWGQTSLDNVDPLVGFRNDDYIELEAAWFY